MGDIYRPLTNKNMEDKYNYDKIQDFKSQKNKKHAQNMIFVLCVMLCI